MIRINKWSGLVTAASPYILPAGGAVEQINAQSRVPGQLTVRNGMSDEHLPDPAAAGLLELWGYSTGPDSPDSIFAYLDTGNVIKIAVPG
jgi:hypothetical protein